LAGVEAKLMNAVLTLENMPLNGTVSSETLQSGTHDGRMPTLEMVEVRGTLRISKFRVIHNIEIAILLYISEVSPR
jgi:hypothetical protein